ncbi:MAG: ABC transporter permease [Lachnospiraceae bacterium]|nr:ABC transporter permease [Lachnospiraceae bacterium]
MLNIIKMDLYRMFRTKSLYVVWIIAAVIMIGTTYLLKAETTVDEFEAASQQEIEESYTEGMPALGIQVMIPAGSDGKITVKDIFYGNAQSKFYALFLVIFTVIFVMADINSGYIKNIGGQIQNRGYLVIAKAISLLVYTVLTMAAMVLVQVLACRLLLGYMELGDIKSFLVYTGIQILLHYALLVICMAVAIILKSSVAGMVIAICLCMDMMVIIYSAIDKVVSKIGVEDFHLIKYTVTGQIAMVSQNPSRKECLFAAIIAAGFAVVCMAAGSVVFKKRDI